MPTLLGQMNEERAHRREAARRTAYEALRAALRELLPPGTEVWVFGSVLKPGRFREDSDLDIAVDCLPPGLTEAWLQYQLALRLDRGVDLFNLNDHPLLRIRIERASEQWTL